MVTGPLVVELTNSCTVSPMIIVFTLGQTSNPSLTWEKADMFKIYDNNNNNNNGKRLMPCV